MVTMANVGERVREAFTENLNLKLLSFLFALVLYSLVHGAQDAQRSFSVPLVLLTPPDGANRVLVSSIPPQVRVTVRGPRPVLDDLRSDDLGTVQLDVRNGLERRVVMEAQMVHVPPGVRVEQIDPPVIDLVWEDRVLRDLPIQIGTLGAPPPGFIVQGAPTQDPVTVRVRGPKSEVAALQYVKGDGFDIQGLSEGKYTRQLNLERPRGNLVLDVAIVTSTVIIAREVASQKFRDVPVRVTGQLRGRASHAAVDVEVVCPQGVTVHKEQLIATVDAPLTQATGSALAPVNVVAPKDCRVTANPPQVHVRW